MKRFTKLSFLFAFSIASASTAVAHDLNVSGKNEIFENPFVVTGYNNASKVVTGSISATRTAPGEINECRILFSGEAKTLNVLKVRYFEIGANDDGAKISRIDQATLVSEGSDLKLKFNKKNLGGECDWLLSYVGEPSIRHRGDDLFISVPKRKVGDWIGVYTIKSKRANFHKVPADANIEKAFLVAGDTIYVYQEKPDWYYVKFQGRKKQTMGWIKKADTVQF